MIKKRKKKYGIPNKVEMFHQLNKPVKLNDIRVARRIRVSSLQEVNAEEFEDKEWTFVIEGVGII